MLAPPSPVSSPFGRLRTSREASARRLALLGLCGVLSALSITTATVVGGAVREGYDPVRDAISRLYEAGAPNAARLMVLFTAYHGLVIPFAYGLHRGLPPAHFGWVGPLLLGTAGLLGVPLGSYARCDVGCWEATTFRGQLHGILVLVTVPLVLAAMFAIWLRLRRREGWRGYARYTLATALVAVAVGLAMVPFLKSDYEGLFERISVAVLIQWYVVMGVRLIAIARGHEAARPDRLPAVG
jgi:hypothetical protein